MSSEKCSLAILSCCKTENRSQRARGTFSHMAKWFIAMALAVLLRRLGHSKLVQHKCSGWLQGWLVHSKLVHRKCSGLLYGKLGHSKLNHSDAEAKGMVTACFHGLLQRFALLACSKARGQSEPRPTPSGDKNHIPKVIPTRLFHAFDVI